MTAQSCAVMRQIGSSDVSQSAYSHAPMDSIMRSCLWHSHSASRLSVSAHSRATLDHSSSKLFLSGLSASRASHCAFVTVQFLSLCLLCYYTAPPNSTMQLNSNMIDLS